MTRVCIHPSPTGIDTANGIGQVVQAQYKHLPSLGIELVGPEQAEVIACHIQQGGLPRVDVLHCHGLLWTGDGPGYTVLDDAINVEIMRAARRAVAITVPSPWVARPFERDMRISPDVIGHGLDLDDWKPAKAHKGYVLWNKNRVDAVCDPTAAIALAAGGIDVVTTFANAAEPLPNTLHVVGPQAHEQMRELVRHAEVYLATTKETFGIGTLEALACGVPVLGYDWGGTADLVEHQVTGYLVKPGDTPGLLEGLTWIREHYTALSKAARKAAQGRSWSTVMRAYADLYERVARELRDEPTGVTVVITNYNYGSYIDEAIHSVLAQTETPQELIVVDDGSADDSIAVISRATGAGGGVSAALPEIQVIQQSNAGVAAARNAGIAKATQPLIVCLDADDRLDPDYVRVLATVLRHDRGIGVAYTGLGLLGEDGAVMPNAWPPDFDWHAQATPSNPPSNCIPCAAMFRKRMWQRAGGYRQVYAPGEDTEFFTRGLSVGFTAERVTDLPLFHYRVHSGSASRTKTYRAIDTWHPWMRDRDYPMAAPSDTPTRIRSYSDPVVTVIIPVGPGHTQYLPAALDSLVGQTNRAWDVVVVYDTDEPLASLAYPFIRTAFVGPGAGPAVARNAGLALVSSPLVLFLDADDYLMPEALEQMLSAFTANDGRYVYTDWLATNGSDTRHDQAAEYSQESWLEHGQHAITVLMATSWAREIGQFDTSLVGWEDWDFFIKLAISGRCGVRVPEPLMMYRQHTGTIRDKSLEHREELLRAFRERYGDYVTGVTSMPGCCGGNGDAILAARAALDAQVRAGTAPAGALVNAAENVAPVAAVRMEFLGPQIGAITYHAHGRMYRGGNNSFDKYVDVDYPEDVALLERTGVWKRVVTR